MNDPYEVLNLQRDASQSDIRKAYRRQSKKVHPDVGGGKDQFNELTMAYDLLSDPLRREHYDATGEDLDKSDHSDDNILAHASHYLNQVCEAIWAKVGLAYEGDFIFDLQTNITHNIAEVSINISKITDVRNELDRMEARIKFGKSPLLKNLIKSKRDTIDKTLKSLDHSNKVMEFCLTTLKDHSSIYEPTIYSSSMLRRPTTSTTSTTSGW